MSTNFAGCGRPFEVTARFQCHLCSKSFGQKGNLYRHVRTVHERIKDFQCIECLQQFSRKNDLARHIGTVHEKVFLFACQTCGNKFRDRSHLVRHIRTVHERIKEFQCPHCPKQFGLNHNLTTHLKRKHGYTRAPPKELNRIKGLKNIGTTTSEMVGTVPRQGNASPPMRSWPSPPPNEPGTALPFFAKMTLGMGIGLGNGLFPSFCPPIPLPHPPQTKRKAPAGGDSTKKRKKKVRTKRRKKRKSAATATNGKFADRMGIVTLFGLDGREFTVQTNVLQPPILAPPTCEDLYMF